MHDLVWMCSSLSSSPWRSLFFICKKKNYACNFPGYYKRLSEGSSGANVSGLKQRVTFSAQFSKTKNPLSQLCFHVFKYRFSYDHSRHNNFLSANSKLYLALSWELPALHLLMWKAGTCSGKSTTTLPLNKV